MGQIVVRLPDDLEWFYRDRAEDNDRKLSAEVRAALELVKSMWTPPARRK